jgi:hypothetical protein
VTRREAWLSAGAIFVVALVVRGAMAAGDSFPAQDSAYYVGVARNLVEGRGLVTDAIWSFSPPPLVFPRPAFEVWLPLPALLFAIPMALVGGGGGDVAFDTAVRASQVVTVLLGSLLPVLAWRLAADVARERDLPVDRARTLALGTGFAAAVYLPLVLHGVQPDSTTLFGLLTVAICLLITRVLRDPRGARLLDPRLLAMGLLLGATALTRNEAAYIALTWAWLAWRRRGLPRVERVRLIGVVAVVSFLVFLPWALRDWAVFGSPLPGQAVMNALSVTPSDIFAWNDPPTLARYLQTSLARLVAMRVEGLGHNLANVLLLLGIPLSLVGLLALPWQGRDKALRPLVIVAMLTFLVTGLAFPVATTWGTFLHAAAPVHVLLLVSALGGLDAALAALARRMGWTKPVTWVGGVMAVAVSAMFTLVLLPNTFAQSAERARRFELLTEGMAAAGAPFGVIGPVITDQPLWMAEAARVPTLALPGEPPSDVLDLATDPRFDARWMVLLDPETPWPDIEANRTDPASACFTQVPLDLPADPADAGLLADVRVYLIECPGS